MYLICIILPLIGSIVTGFLGRYLGRKGGAIFSATCTFSSFFISCLVFYEVALCGSTCSLEIMPWFFSEMFDGSWGFYFDTLTGVMLLVITSISSLVKIYSMSYMEQDPDLPRFMSYLSIFTFFMLMLVTADNLLQMFFGWEGVGLASYLLINFWFTRQSANKASIKAMLLNRVGDFGLALGIMAVFFAFKTVNFAAIFAAAPFLYQAKFVFLNNSFDALNSICLLLFVGAIGKSAQLGLHTWLPDAMEGPTPVSALIHAATMVTAGVFLLARFSPVFEYAPTALMIVSFVGASTCFFAATTGIFQNDIKRVIAYSTCSQLGYMVFACGISHYSVGVFHLFNHAFFKALLFLSAGSVIHALSNQQDMRRMGGLVQLLPLTYAMMLIGSLSLVGFPFLTGFYSKDVILEVAYARYTVNGIFAYWLGGICVLFTSYYSFRLLFLTFLVRSSTYKKYAKHIHEAPILMATPLILLSIASIFIGFLGKDMMIGIGTSFWSNALFTLPQNNSILESEYIPQFAKMLPFFFTLLGICLALLTFGSQFSEKFLCNTQNKYTVARGYYLKSSGIGYRFYSFFNKRWFFDKIYNDYIAYKVLYFGYKVSFKTLDKGAFEIVGPQGICLVFSKIMQGISRLQSGMIYHYAIIIYIGLTLFITAAGFSHYLEQYVDARIYFVLLLTFPFIHFTFFYPHKNSNKS